MFGLVTYASGRLGNEPVRSQGHVHKKSEFANNWSTPEVYEIWAGRAIIYMQESAGRNPGRCFAVQAKAGQVVIVPPGWAHSTISLDSDIPMTFGAWCDRDYGFDYKDVRANNGLAWFPMFNSQDILEWRRNPAYRMTSLVEKTARDYPEFDIQSDQPIYTQFEENPEKFLFVSRPDLYSEKWTDFTP